MANIRVDVGTTIRDGTAVAFRSPVDCSQITGLIVYYPGEDGNETSKEFAFADAHGNNVGDIDHLFAENVVVKVILDVTSGMAFVQNADTNAYIEKTFVKSVNGDTPDENGNVDIDDHAHCAYVHTEEGSYNSFRTKATSKVNCVIYRTNPYILSGFNSDGYVFYRHNEKGDLEYVRINKEDKLSIGTIYYAQTVNGIAPDENGNVDVDVKSVYEYAVEAGYEGTEEEFATQLTNPVKTVNGIEPDENGNVQVESGATSWNDLTDKPFGDGCVIIADGVVNDGGEFLFPGAELILGDTYIVEANGEELSCGVVDHDDFYALDIPDEFAGDAFIGVQYWPESQKFEMYAMSEAMRVTVYHVTAETLDEKYIPDTIARKTDIPDIPETLIVTTEGDRASHTGIEIEEVIKNGGCAVLVTENGHLNCTGTNNGFAYFYDVDDLCNGYLFYVWYDGKFGHTDIHLPTSEEWTTFEEAIYCPTTEVWTFELDDGTTVTKQVVVKND